MSSTLSLGLLPSMQHLCSLPFFRAPDRKSQIYDTGAPLRIPPVVPRTRERVEYNFEIEHFGG